MNHLTAAWARVAMPVGPPPPGVRYLVTTNHPRGDFTRSYNMLGAFLGEDIIGYITWGIQGRKVASIWVKPEYRRRRIAETMFAYAQSVDPRISHHVDRSDEGEAWVRATTPDAPERENNSGRGEYESTYHDRSVKQRLLSKDPRDQHRILDLTPGARAASKMAMPMNPPQGLEIIWHDGLMFVLNDAAVAILDGEVIGFLGVLLGGRNLYDTWHETDMLYIKPEHRRRGIATLLFQKVKQQKPDVRISDNRTADAEAWVNSDLMTGNDVPPKFRGLTKADAERIGAEVLVKWQGIIDRERGARAASRAQR